MFALSQVYPEGQMTQLLDKLKIGDTVLIKGPKGRFKYRPNEKEALGECLITCKPTYVLQLSSVTCSCGLITCVFVLKQPP